VDASLGRRRAQHGLSAGRDADRRIITAAIGRANNLYAESLVALDLKTGEKKWHFQFVHHPIWNFDMSSTPIIADITVDGAISKRSR
jgi:glucose dehydrogenase